MPKQTRLQVEAKVEKFRNALLRIAAAPVMEGSISETNKDLAQRVLGDVYGFDNLKRWLENATITRHVNAMTDYKSRAAGEHDER